MLELERLIQKFWTDRTTPEENQRLLELLGQDKAPYLRKLEGVFNGAMKDQASGLQPEQAQALLDRLHSRLGVSTLDEDRQHRRSMVRRIVAASAVAASVVALTVSLLLPGRSRQEPQAVKTTNVAQEFAQMARLSNMSDTVMSVVLEDGSTVQLGRQSSLNYYRPFTGRDLWLEGSGMFKVAKDTRRPFTVYASGTATTALGTKFWVSSGTGREVIVRLLEGRVVINSAAGSGLVMKGVYLSPGQEFSLDKNHLQYIVKNIVPKFPGRTGSLPETIGRQDLVFNQAPLERVFGDIGRLYHVTVRFKKTDLNGLYFTGTFLRTDDLNRILSTICNVNDLLLMKDQYGIIITRPH